MLLIHSAEFAANFNRKAFQIGHTLVGHPLFELPRLVQLAQRLSPAGGANSVLYFRGDNAINQVDAHAATSSNMQQTPRQTFVARNLERPNLSVEETVAQIESCNAWMQLRDVGADPQYKLLLDEVMKEFAEHAGEGVHIPPCHAHWVHNGIAVSVSLGVWWQSDHTARHRASRFGRPFSSA